ncbi:MAG: CvpA family protein [Nitrospinae bacterium]|nr:CvpA family protein [Nitrospinota bacterium]
MSIHWFDIFVAVFLTASMVWSFFRGFAREAFSLFSVVAGYFMASRYYPGATPLFAKFFGEGTLADIAAFAALFFLTVTLVVVTGIFVRRVLHISSALSVVDKTAGAGLGLVKGCLILAIIVYPLALVPALKEEMAEGSVAAPVLINLGRLGMAKLAPNLASDLEGAAKVTVEKTREAKDRAKKITDSIKAAEGLLNNGEEKKSQAKKAPADEAPKEPRENVKPKDSGSKKAPAKPKDIGKKPEKDDITDYDRREMEKLLERAEKPGRGR